MSDAAINIACSIVFGDDAGFMDHADAARLAAFLNERDAALLSMDRSTITTFMQAHSLTIPDDEGTFWAAVHHARVATRTLPMDARTESKRQLLAWGEMPMDDGEVPS